MPTDTKLDPFKPVQPHIPGVPKPSSEEKAQAAREKASPPPATTYVSPHAETPARSPVLLWLALAVGVVVILGGVGILWWMHKSSAKLDAGSSPVRDTAVATADDAVPAGKLPIAPGEIATAAELSKVWSAKRFIFHNRLTSENVDAIAVRLPGGALWAISLREPYGNCELKYVTDLGALLSQYKFAAEHPMVVNPCTGAIYDLASYSSGPNGLVRGEIVHGGAVRPPIAIEVVARGNKIVATRIE